ncbi:MAG: hypothetical protein QM811_31430 [Pirellulales bacterium]
MPLSLELADLANATLIVALKEAEHRPKLLRDFPDWTDRVEYWHVHDVDCSHPRDALSELRILVDALFARLTQPEKSEVAS